MKKLDYLNQNGLHGEEADKVKKIIEIFEAEPDGVTFHQLTWEQIKQKATKHNRSVLSRRY